MTETIAASTTSILPTINFRLVEMLRRKQLWQLRLAELAENDRLEQTLRGRMTEPITIGGAAHVLLPDVGSLDELWEMTGGEYDAVFDGYVPPAGVYRQLDEALLCITGEGFFTSDLQVFESGNQGVYNFLWGSARGGCGVSRWVIVGQFHWQGGRVTTSSVLYAKPAVTATPRQTEWSVYKGALLDQIISVRLSDQVLPVIGLRVADYLGANHLPTGVWLEAPTGADQDEVGQDGFAASRTCKQRAIAVICNRQGYRAVLWDDTDAYGTILGDVDAFRTILIQLALTYYRVR